MSRRPGSITSSPSVGFSSRVSCRAQGHSRRSTVDLLKEQMRAYLSPLPPVSHKSTQIDPKAPVRTVKVNEW